MPRLEERGGRRAHRRHDERTVEEVVALLAARLGDQQAAVAGGAVQRAALAGRVRGVLGADRSASKETNAPSPRFSIAGSQVSVPASAARCTSMSISPSLSGPIASKVAGR